MVRPPTVAGQFQTLTGFPSYTRNILRIENHVDTVAEAPDGDDEHDDGNGTVDDLQCLQFEMIANLIDKPSDE